MLTKHLLRVLLLMALCGTAFANSSPELSEPLRIIRAVGMEGQGNPEASGAWKKLAQANRDALLPILEAMDGANDYALNWLRPAFETIATREGNARVKLLLPQLGRFLLETRHNPRGRRLAFEWIQAIDPGTADKLLTGLLNDPSLELRHEAVQKLMGQAEQSLTSSNQTGAILLYQQALGSARDVKQIGRITDQLKELGQPVDLQKLFGFLVDWKVIGPFDNSAGKGFETVYPPEQKIDLTAEHDGKLGKVRWQNYHVKDQYGHVDMNEPYGRLKSVAAYATTSFVSDRAQPVELRLGGENSWKVWLNGKLLFARDEYHDSAEIDQYVMPAQLQAGQNTILVKVCQNEKAEDWTVQWDFQLRITDSLGTPFFSAASAGPSEAGVVPIEKQSGKN